MRGMIVKVCRLRTIILLIFYGFKGHSCDHTASYTDNQIYNYLEHKKSPPFKYISVKDHSLCKQSLYSLGEG